MAIHHWPATLRPALAKCLGAIGEIEQLSSYASSAFEHPADPFPEVRAGAPLFHAQGLTHPLIPAKTAVANDVVIGGGGPQVLLVSGSNMSGKSTLLRGIRLKWGVGPPRAPGPAPPPV